MMTAAMAVAMANVEAMVAVMGEAAVMCDNSGSSNGGWKQRHNFGFLVDDGSNMTGNSGRR